MKSRHLQAAVIMLVLAVVVALRLFTYRKSYDELVQVSLRTTEGYDSRLVDMVNRMEKDLAVRASFGYAGGKDPMTGRTREVLEKAPARRERSTEAAEPKAAAAPPDPVKVTAIIFDDAENKYTAVVMDGERSYSVQVGDVVQGRRITKITSKMLHMESNEMSYKYDIYGNSESRRKLVLLPGASKEDWDRLP